MQEVPEKKGPTAIILSLRNKVLRQILKEKTIIGIRPKLEGFRVTNAGCCGVGRNNGQVTCLPLQTPCRNRNAFLFWDAFHPTEAANTIIGRRAYNAHSASDAYPVDINRLAQI
ncbi:GDSL esterase/lipase [Glycine soja]|uniref:GDSL esterase/lipase n=1 Tax=Glycine soja TaxID=3848 RepID=A0A445I8K2_GLYSO|nr:GDSL esterase/lipase [Glycine soja]